jgi:hypothetical protein
MQRASDWGAEYTFRLKKSLKSSDSPRCRAISDPIGVYQDRSMQIDLETRFGLLA